MECSSISTRLAVAIATAPPEPPSPMTTAMSGTPSARQRSVARAVGMACNLRLLPGRQPGVGIDQRLLRLLLQPRDLFGDRYRAVVLDVEGLEVGHLALELGDRLLEIEIGANGEGSVHQLVCLG